ncbi:unnamed protein product [Cuscuta epithymum]|uniref:Uncharacterized protein n=1 Tax=Cuscuta epithymum TaxID=186058 RepID=A0AAV0CZP4_9ASTE|nr:unnamed protein product [Cuscuta epithymum]
MAMRGVGGPLLCIGDLLSDVGEDGSGCDNLSRCGDIKTPSFSESCPSFRPSDLPKLFQENYEKLNEALAGTDHSWTALTLELCSAMQTANKLVDSANCNAGKLSENVQTLQEIINRRDSNIAAAKAIQKLPEWKRSPDSENHLQI